MITIKNRMHHCILTHTFQNDREFMEYIINLKSSKCLIECFAFNEYVTFFEKDNVCYPEYAGMKIEDFVRSYFHVEKRSA